MKHFLLTSVFVLFLTSCSNDDDYIRKDFEMTISKNLEVSGNSLNFDIELDSDSDVQISQYQIPGIDETTGDILMDETILSESSLALEKRFSIRLEPTPGNGYKSFSFQLSNGPSKKFVNVQYLLENEEIPFVSISYTTNTSERLLVTNYGESIFKADFFSSQNYEVFLDNGTDNPKVATLRSNGPSLSYITSNGGTDVFTYFVQPSY